MNNSIYEVLFDLKNVAYGHTVSLMFSLINLRPYCTTSPSEELCDWKLVYPGRRMREQWQTLSGVKDLVVDHQRPQKPLSVQ